MAPHSVSQHSFSKDAKLGRTIRENHCCLFRLYTRFNFPSPRSLPISKRRSHYMGSIKIPTSIFLGHIGWEMGSRGGGEANLPFLSAFYLRIIFARPKCVLLLVFLKRASHSSQRAELFFKASSLCRRCR